MMVTGNMSEKRVSVAEGKKEFTQLLHEAAERKIHILVFRHDAFAGAILPPEEYELFERLRAYFEALRLSQKFSSLKVTAAELAEQSRSELEERSL